MKGTLHDKLEAFQKDAQSREQRHNTAQNDWRIDKKDIGKFKPSVIESRLEQSTAYKPSQKEQIKVGKVENVQKYEQEALEYEEQRKQERFVRQKKEEQIAQLMEEHIAKTIGKSEWDKSKIQQWMDAILKSTGALLDKYLTDGVYKYAVDVHILKSTAIARQSDTLQSSTDYSINLKVKNGRGIIVVANCHAFKVN